MTFIDAARTQTATFWDEGAPDGHGDPSFVAPVALLVRWEQQSVAFTNASGEEEKSESVVFLGQDVAVGDWLFLGTSVQASPHNELGARKVKGFVKIPSIDGTLFDRRALL